VGSHSENITWRSTVALEMLPKVREIAVGHRLWRLLGKKAVPPWSLETACAIGRINESKVNLTPGDIHSIHGNETITLMPGLPLLSAVGTTSSVGK
jgi:hypothetical protein